MISLTLGPSRSSAIERTGFQVIRARRLEDAEIAVQTDAAIGCMVVDWGKNHPHRPLKWRMKKV
jgi:Orn/Lys/Arg decarboxylase, N-terminal domain